MRRLLLAVALAWAMLASPSAQTGTVISWTHSGTNVTRFQLQIAANWVIEAGLPTPTGTTYQYTLPALPSGSYAVVVRACYGTTCNDSTTLYVSKTSVLGATNHNLPDCPGSDVAPSISGT